MANSEDVLERYELAMSMQDIHGFVGVGFDLITALAAVVRELRKDRERLDWLERHIEDDTPLLRWSDGSWSTSMFGPWSGCRATAREAIDAAMAQENNDGE